MSVIVTEPSNDSTRGAGFQVSDVFVSGVGLKMSYFPCPQQDTCGFNAGEYSIGDVRDPPQFPYLVLHISRESSPESQTFEQPSECLLFLCGYSFVRLRVNEYVLDESLRLRFNDA